MAGRFKNPWSTEEEIAAAVRAQLEADGWEVHPECNGWDLFAVARSVVPYRNMHHLRPGDTLGVECKLDAGTATGLGSLLRQVLPLPRRRQGPWSPEAEPGPHYRAAASARINADGGGVLRACGVATWVLSTGRFGGEWTRNVPSPLYVNHRFSPAKVPTVPEIVIDVPAGVPSPSTSSPWKIKAVRIMLRMRSGQPVTSADFDAAGLNIATFRNEGWIKDTGRRIGRRYVWEATDSGRWNAPPDLRWPEIATALEAKAP